MGELKKIQSIKSHPSEKVLKLLDQLARELDQYFNDPTSYPKKRLTGVVETFFLTLIETLQEDKLVDSLKSQIKSSSVFEPQSWIKWIQSARRLLRSDEVDDYGCDRQFEMAIKPFFDFLYFKYFRVEATGLENVPRSGSGLIVANHSGVLPYDASMLKIAIYNEHETQRELRFLVDDFVFHFPFLGTFMNRIGGVRACPENAERLLKHGELVSVFPEGIKGIAKKFSERYHLQRFGRGGVIKLALKTKAPIIPTAIVGAEEIHPLIYKSSVLARPLGFPFIPVTPTFPILGPLGLIPLPTKWTIHFGSPIDFSQHQEGADKDGILVNRETEKLRSVVQTMVFDLLKERRSVFMG